METIDERIKRANSKYKVEETIDERIERVNREYEWDSRDREMHDWLESSSRTTRNANSRLQNSSYTNWKRDSESTRASVDADLERADRIKSYLESQREQLEKSATILLCRDMQNIKMLCNRLRRICRRSPTITPIRVIPALWTP